jgi:predicted Zn-dependent peptidase
MQYITSKNDPGIFKHKVLKNGINLFYRQSDQTFGLPNVACSAVVQVGGRDDTPGKEGVAHFFEHMPFRGTESFPTLKDLTYPIESNGGYVNAFTTDEATGYEIIIPSSLLEEGIKRVSDMLMHPLLRPDDIETERQVILEELRNKLASVAFYARQELYKQLLGAHPLVHAVIGTEAALNAIQPDDLKTFHNRFYNANTISLFFAGSFDTDTLFSLCETYFGSIGDGDATTRTVSPASITLQNNSLELSPKRYNRSVYLLGRVMPPAALKETVMNKLFRDMLIRGMDSPLYSEIRDKRGLAYNLGLSHNRYQDVSLLLFSVSTQFKHMNEVEALFWQTIKNTLPDAARFDEVKYMFKQAILHREYSVGALVDSAIDSYLDYGQVVSLNEFIDELEAVSHAEMVAYIDQYLTPEEFLAIKVNCDKKINASKQKAV